MVKKLLYPPRCPFCGKINRTGHPCERCMKSAKELVDEICPRCGADPAFCKCRGRGFSFRRNISAFVYAGGPRLMLLRYKERNKPQLAVFMADRMTYHIDARYKEPFDAITYVPQSRWKSICRGYCPAKLLAERLGERFRLPLIEPLRRRGNRQQKYLSAAGRRKNAKKSFTLCKEASLYGRILLIDDLFTTGATVDACAALLKEAGAAEVCTATFCIAAKKS